MKFVFFRGLVAVAACFGSAALGGAKAVTFTVFTNPHPVVSGGTIGFAYAGNKFVGSVQGDGGGLLYSTDLNGGNVAVFAPTVSLVGSPSGEHFVASSLGLGGFPSRDIYVAEGSGIHHITNDGTADDVFVSGLASSVRGILFDAIGTFGNDMLVTTNGGHVYRITSAGVPTLLAEIGLDTEGLDIAPLGAGFGAFDGQLIVASEGTGQLRAITPGGTVTLLPVSIPFGPEELTFVPLNLGASGDPVEGFYGSDYTPDVIKAAASEFIGLQGDAVVTSEVGDHRVTLVHWNGSIFETSVIGNFPNQPEDGIFVTASIINPCGADNHPPRFDSPTPACGSVLQAQAGLTLDFSIAASDPDTDATVALDVVGLPSGAALAPPLPISGNPVGSEFTWVPSAGDAGDHGIQFTAIDNCGVAVGCSLTVHVQTNRNPDCTAASAGTGTLWPPNHRLAPVTIVGVTDPDGDPVTVTVAGVTQDEPLNDRGDGNTCPDAVIQGGSAEVRVERSGPPGVPGNGRVYTIAFTATDGQGGSCAGTVDVCVPHDQGAGHLCVKDAVGVDSLGPCNSISSKAPSLLKIGGTERSRIAAP